MFPDEFCRLHVAGIESRDEVGIDKDRRGQVGRCRVRRKVPERVQYLYISIRVSKQSMKRYKLFDGLASPLGGDIESQRCGFQVVRETIRSDLSTPNGVKFVHTGLLPPIRGLVLGTDER